DTGDADLDDALAQTLASGLAGSTHVDAIAGAELLAMAARVKLPPTDVEAIAARRASTTPSPFLTVHGRVHRDGGTYSVTIESGPFSASRSASGADALVPVTAELATTLLVALGDPPAATERRTLSTSAAAIHAWTAGVGHSMAGESKEALAAYRHAIELDPEFATARAALGLELYNGLDKEPAITQLERAIRNVDRFPERARLTLLGDYYGIVGRYSESILAYQQLLAKWPGDGRTELNLTATAIDANSWPLALEVARTVAKEHGEFEIARRNLVLAEVGNSRFDDAVRDGTAMLAEIHNPSSPGVTALASSYALLGRHAEAVATLAKLAAIDPDRQADAVADLAVFEGRLDDALAALKGHQLEIDSLLRASVALRRGDRPAAIAAANITVLNETMPSAYLGASTLVAAGETKDAAAKIRRWGVAPETEHQIYGQLLAGDVARAEQRWTDAIAAYKAAARLGDGWLIHDRLARAYLGAKQAFDAEQELVWCIDHRGAASLVGNPSLWLLPEVYLELARCKDARGADPKEIRAAYQAFADLAPAPQHDPWSDEVRARLAALPP
ncbi:MAG TPA: tetratricopeptide repeat protein, partial [Kofleriaceae bacterium]|nr:tetratricopeptide repeat protein [Kofleriaceae bacterium]